MPVVSDYTALLGGDTWNGIEVTGRPVIVTYSFPTSAPAYDSSVAGFTASTVASFQAFNATEQAQARSALGEWAAASGLIFVEVAPGQGDINFQLVDFNTTSGPSYAGAGGIAFYPFGDWNFFTQPTSQSANFQSDLDASGDVFMNTQFAAGGSVTYGTLLHEIGHAIGLKHPTETVSSAFVTHDQTLDTGDDPTRTIMATVGDTGSGDHLKQLDKNAAAFLYGTAGSGGVFTTNHSGSNGLVSWNWNAGTQILKQTGTAGDDTIRGSSVTDNMVGSDGNDRLFGLNGDDTLNGGNGNDILFGGPGVDRMIGGAGDDTYYVDNAADVTTEGVDAGFDTVIASVSFQLKSNFEQLQMFGDSLTGKGNNAANTIFGDPTLHTTLYGLGGDDYIGAGSAADTLHGGDGNDTVWSGAGDDTVTGDAGNDWLHGEAGNDKLNGGDGDDVLFGGLGKDALTGGAGSDTFVFDTAPVSTNVDTIKDFVSGVDKIELAAAIFGSIGPTLDASEFVVGSSAADANDYVIYNPTTGKLYYDDDGNGAHAAKQIALLTGIPALNSTDFVIA